MPDDYSIPDTRSSGSGRGFSVVTRHPTNPRASTLNGFMFGGGPARRFVAEARTLHPNAVQVIPGGESGNPSGPWFGNQLGLWLTDDYHGVTTVRGEVLSDAVQQQHSCRRAELADPGRSGPDPVPRGSG